jgi:hypothetical protein
MCVVSNVSDYYWERHFKPLFPQEPVDWSKWVPKPTVDLEELRRLIDEFKEAIKAAKTIDKLTMQPDCVDPEKAKLQARIAELEKKLAQISVVAAR